MLSLFYAIKTINLFNKQIKRAKTHIGFAHGRKLPVHFVYNSYGEVNVEAQSS